MPSTVKPAFSATRREAVLPTFAFHSIRARPSVVKPQALTATSAAGR